MKTLTAIGFCIGCAAFTSGFTKPTTSPLDQDTIEQATTKLKPTNRQTAQQIRMMECINKATGKKTEDEKRFISSCMKGKSSDAPHKQHAHADKMTSCNKEASGKSMKVDSRKNFMNKCLKG